MTDNEIIKALECCKRSVGAILCTSNCPMYSECDSEDPMEDICGLALDLINRQKAEINKLKQENDFFRKTITENAQRALEVTVEEIETAKSEAIKEFAKRLKDNYCFTDRWGKIIVISTVDNLVKEMTEVNEK